MVSKLSGYFVVVANNPPEAPTPRPIYIGLFSHFFPKHRGGVEIVAGHLAEALAQDAGVAITWFASDCDPPPNLKGVSCQPIPAWNPLERRFHVPYPIWTPLRLRSLWQAIQTADIVHVHDYIYVGSLAAFVIAKMQGKPVLITQHVGAVPFRNRLVRWSLTLANRTLGRAMLKRADATVFVSAVVRDLFLPDGRRDGMTLLIPNGLDRLTFFPVAPQKRQALRRIFGIADGRACFLFVGRFVEKKGLALLEKLTASLPDVLWIFAGRGELDPEGWGRNNVQVFRDHSGSSLADLYRVADLLVLPSVGEGFPLVVQEAMACGTPAIVSRETASALPGIDQLLFAENITGNDTLPTWHQRLDNLSRFSQELVERRTDVAAWAASHWSWERCANAYREVIHKILKLDEKP